MLANKIMNKTVPAEDSEPVCWSPPPYLNPANLNKMTVDIEKQLAEIIWIAWKRWVNDFFYVSKINLATKTIRMNEKAADKRGDTIHDAIILTS